MRRLDLTYTIIGVCVDFTLCHELRSEKFFADRVLRVAFENEVCVRVERLIPLLGGNNAYADRAHGYPPKRKRGGYSTSFWPVKSFA